MLVDENLGRIWQCGWQSRKPTVSLGCIRSVAKRLREVVAHLCSAPLGPHLEHLTPALPR